VREPLKGESHRKGIADRSLATRSIGRQPCFIVQKLWTGRGRKLAVDGAGPENGPERSLYTHEILVAMPPLAAPFRVR
jgi:hypothetical protein